MSAPDKKLTYVDFILPEQKEMIDKAEHAKAGIPIFYTRHNLSDLFQMSALDVTQMSQLKATEKLDIETAPIDRRIKKAFTAPGKEHVSHVSEAGLLMGFCLLGYASSLGRIIEFMASGVENDGTIKEYGEKEYGLLVSKLFNEYKHDPLSGSKALFQAISESIGNPERMLLMNYITPDSTLN